MAAKKNAELFMNVDNLGAFTGKLFLENARSLKDEEDDEIGKLIME